VHKTEENPIQNIITLCTVLLFLEYWSPEKPDFWIFVKCEQRSTKVQKFDLVSMVTIDLPLLLNSLFSYISDLGTLKLQNWSPHFQNEKILNMIPHSRISSEITMSKEAFQKFQPWTKHIQTTTFHSINTDVCIIFNSVWGRIISKMTKIYAGRSGVQILAGATELSHLQNIQTSSSSHPASNYSFDSGSKLAWADNLTTHIRLQPSFKISRAIPTINLSPSMEHSGTLFNPNHLPMYICVKKSHPF